MCATLKASEIYKTEEESGGERQMREAAVMGSKVTAGGVKSVRDKNKELVK